MFTILIENINYNTILAYNSNFFFLVEKSWSLAVASEVKSEQSLLYSIDYINNNILIV